MVESSTVRVVVDPKSALFVSDRFSIIAMTLQAAAFKSRTQRGRALFCGEVSRHDRLTSLCCNCRADRGSTFNSSRKNIDSSASTLIRINKHSSFPTSF